MKYVACIGSRILDIEEQKLCFRIGQFLSQGYIIKTGNAKGADQAYARGVNSIDPSKVRLYLPWKDYNIGNVVEGNVIACLKPKIKWYSVVKDLHLTYDTLSYGAKTLHARNVGIVEDVDFVVAFPNKTNGGGTVMGIRIALKNNITVYNLRENKDLEYWKNIVG
jgi:hypothetical protein